MHERHLGQHICTRNGVREVIVQVEKTLVMINDPRKVQRRMTVVRKVVRSSR